MMSSGSSNTTPDDSDDDIQCHLDKVNVNMNTEIHSMVQHSCYTNISTAEGIVINNEFLKKYLTTREWD